MIRIDGSRGEGGGQILRTSLALSLVTGKPFRIEAVRAGRRRPGLMRQHLTAVNAAAEVGGGEVAGNAIGSRELEFRPGRVEAGKYRFSIGSAGSATLVLQALLPALAVAGGPSEVVIEGGTHNPFAPPFDFLERTLLPLLRRMGIGVSADISRHGFYPAGGGRFTVTVAPGEGLGRLVLEERGAVTGTDAVAMVANLPEGIARRELSVVRQKLGWPEEVLAVRKVEGSPGPGNALLLAVRSEALTEVFAGFGERGVPAEKVAGRVVGQVRQYLASGAPVGKYLADQLLVPMAMAGGGCFRTLPPTSHTLTNIEVIRRFLEVEIRTREIEGGLWEIAVG